MIKKCPHLSQDLKVRWIKKKNRKGKIQVFCTSLLDYSRKALTNLYQQPWGIEEAYKIIKYKLEVDNRQVAAGDVILLAAQYYDHNQYKVNAYTNGDVTVSNNRIYDVAGRNPYDTKRAFAVAPMEYHLKGNSFAFKLQSNMIYANTSKTARSIDALHLSYMLDELLFHYLYF